MKQDDYCSLTCPYLKKTPESDKRYLPFFCELYRVFLGAERDNPCRCEGCLGKSINATKGGYDLISSFPQTSVDKRKTKWGFHRLPATEQDKFVRLVRQSGIILGIEENTPLNTAKMVRDLAEQMTAVQETPANPKTVAAEQFNALLDKLDADFPGLINDSTKDLLSNLFLSLDATEQDLMQSVLSNPERIDGFIKEIEGMPKNDHMIKDLRRVLDEQQKQTEMEDRQREQENQRLIQMALQRQIEQQRREEEKRKQEEQRRQNTRAMREAMEKEAERQRQEQERREAEQRQQEYEIELTRQREEEERQKKEKEENLRRQREAETKEKDAAETAMKNAGGQEKQNSNTQQQMRTMQAMRAGMEGRG